MFKPKFKKLSSLPHPNYNYHEILYIKIDNTTDNYAKVQFQCNGDLYIIENNNVNILMEDNNVSRILNVEDELYYYKNSKFYKIKFIYSNGKFKCVFNGEIPNDMYIFGKSGDKRFTQHLKSFAFC